MKTGILLCSLFAAIAVAPVSGKEKYREIVNADTPDKFEQITFHVRKEMEAGGRYEFVKPDERTTIERKLVEMEALFKRSGSVAAMNEGDKIKLFNDQEVVNSILTMRDSDRVICANRAHIGSHIPVTSCHTFGQEEEARRGTSKIMHAWDHSPCSSKACNPEGGGGAAGGGGG
jgi:hypothetical protein